MESIARILPSRTAGTIAAPPSKSAAHRALICAALAGGGRIDGILPSADMRATLGAVEALGASFIHTGNRVTVHRAAAPAAPVVDCLESGSTLRFLLPILAALGIPATFIGRGRLPQRPLGVYADCLPAHGVRLRFHCGGGLPLTLEGRLEGGRYDLPGDVSSQFISGLLFALPLCREDSDICLTSPLESAAYVRMTLDALARAGVRTEETPHGWHIPGRQTYQPADVQVEGDWSQAAFLLAAGALGGEAAITGLDPSSAQGDREALPLFQAFGADADWSDGLLRCRRADLHGIDIDASQIPDLVPVLAVTGALAEGTTVIRHAARLRLKESDRLAAMADCLTLLGGHVEERPDGLVIQGVPRLQGGRVPGCNDHRIVMSMAVAALGCEEAVEVTDPYSVEKSWPGFFEDFNRIGGNAHVVDHR